MAHCRIMDTLTSALTPVYEKQYEQETVAAKNLSGV